jgi:hypothetical protein
MRSRPPLNLEVSRFRSRNSLLVTAVQNKTGQPSFTVTRIEPVAIFAWPAGSLLATGVDDHEIPG